MELLKEIHHVAIICSDYARSKAFYLDVLGLELMAEHYRADRDSYKADLGLNGHYLIELFSFPSPPARLTHPEAAGLRHISFWVENIDDAIRQLRLKGVGCEDIRVDPYMGKRFTFFSDPDNLPIELYER